MIIKKSEIRQYVFEKTLLQLRSEEKTHKVSEEFLEELDLEVQRIIHNAMKRAIRNNRNTLLGRDV